MSVLLLDLGTYKRLEVVDEEVYVCIYYPDKSVKDFLKMTTSMLSSKYDIIWDYSEELLKNQMSTLGLNGDDWDAINEDDPLFPIGNLV
jgi:hypothetical protein